MKWLKLVGTEADRAGRLRFPFDARPDGLVDAPGPSEPRAGSQRTKLAKWYENLLLSVEFGAMRKHDAFSATLSKYSSALIAG